MQSPPSLPSARTPYASSVAADSPFRSVSSGTLACIRYAISYCAIRASISGSPKLSDASAFNAPVASSIRRRVGSSIPSGLERYRTGSPCDRNRTP